MRYHVYQFSDKTDNFEFLGPNVPKNGFWVRISKIPYVSIFSQNGQLLIFWPKFGEIAKLRAIFWFKYCWGCCRELGGSWNELGGGGWSLVEFFIRATWIEIKRYFSSASLYWCWIFLIKRSMLITFGILWGVSHIYFSPKVWPCFHLFFWGEDYLFFWG